VPGVEAGDVETSVAQPMHKPWRHGASLQADLRVISRVPPYRALDPLRVRGALAAPHPATGLVDDADRRQLLRNVQANKSGHRAAFHAADHRAERPDRGTMEASGPQPRLPDVHTCTTLPLDACHPRSNVSVRAKPPPRSLGSCVTARRLTVVWSGARSARSSGPMAEPIRPSGLPERQAERRAAPLGEKLHRRWR
jgi:hypothetical protein